ncbi:hypothetical protein CBR_g23891 [Chara braunii]|uniref:Protein kinase domain-containing protein n=1 Tax=Chara braunii TaxID=69332 RepID=A0A388L5C3_CHABU|nr:hypothetical protein CBR_g23891 [Chara braunii]|eukprot:GBG77442.1 hypothetical protein CBR_g23891 [Chara braunii]
MTARLDKRLEEKNCLKTKEKSIDESALKDEMEKIRKENEKLRRLLTKGDGESGDDNVSKLQREIADLRRQVLAKKIEEDDIFAMKQEIEQLRISGAAMREDGEKKRVAIRFASRFVLLLVLCVGRSWVWLGGLSVEAHATAKEPVLELSHNGASKRSGLSVRSLRGGEEDSDPGAIGGGGEHKLILSLSPAAAVECDSQPAQWSRSRYGMSESRREIRLRSGESRSRSRSNERTWRLGLPSSASRSRLARTRGVRGSGCISSVTSQTASQSESGGGRRQTEQEEEGDDVARASDGDPGHRLLPFTQSRRMARDAVRTLGGRRQTSRDGSRLYGHWPGDERLYGHWPGDSLQDAFGLSGRLRPRKVMMMSGGGDNGSSHSQVDEDESQPQVQVLEDGTLEVVISDGEHFVQEIQNYENEGTTLKKKTIRVRCDLVLPPVPLRINSSGILTVKGECWQRVCVVRSKSVGSLLLYDGLGKAGDDSVSLTFSNLDFYEVGFEYRHANVKLINCSFVNCRPIDFKHDGDGNLTPATTSNGGGGGGGADRLVKIRGCSFRDNLGGLRLLDMPETVCISHSVFYSMREDDVLVVRTNTFADVQRRLTIFNCTFGSLQRPAGWNTVRIEAVNTASPSLLYARKSTSESNTSATVEGANTTISFLNSTFFDFSRVAVFAGNGTSSPAAEVPYLSLRFCSSTWASHSEIPSLPAGTLATPLSSSILSLPHSLAIFCPLQSTDGVQTANPPETNSSSSSSSSSFSSACAGCTESMAGRCEVGDGDDDKMLFPSAPGLLNPMGPQADRGWDGGRRGEGGQRGEGSNRALATILAVTVPLAAVMVLATAAGAKRWSSRHRQRVIGGRTPTTTVTGSRRDKQHEELLRLRVFTIKELREATTNFTTVVGRGGSAVVYKATLASGELVAVKSLKREHWRNEHEFLHEVCILGRIAHRNLVLLLGYCNEEERYFLVYEFVPNGTLKDHLHQHDVKSSTSAPLLFLDWPKRVRIALEIARALEYLHHLLDPPLVHRDIKPENVLLLQDCVPKVADFGLCRKFNPQEDGSECLLTNPAGTVGYMAPEVFTGFTVTEKVDVFSFGVLLLEIITGKRPFSKDFSLIVWVRKTARDEESAKALADPRLEGAVDSRQLYLLTLLARRCLQRKSTSRPSMLNVARALERIQGMSSNENMENVVRVLERIQGEKRDDSWFTEWCTEDSEWLSALHEPNLHQDNEEADKNDEGQEEDDEEREEEMLCEKEDQGEEKKKKKKKKQKEKEQQLKEGKKYNIMDKNEQEKQQEGEKEDHGEDDTSLGVEAMSAKAVKDIAEVSEVLLKGTTIDQDIVEVDENVLLQDVSEDVVHRPLEGSGCIGEAEWHHLKLVVAEARSERCLRLVGCSDVDLMVTATKLIGTRHGVVVLNHAAFETAIVDAETKSFIRFASKEDGCTPRGVAGLNETQSQELLKLTLEFGGLGDRESVGCLVVNTVVRHKLTGVLDVIHRWDAGLQERRWENVVAFSDEVTNYGLQVNRISCVLLSVSVSVSVSERRRGGLDGRRRDGSRDGSHGDRRRIWLQRDELDVGTGWIIV